MPYLNYLDGFAISRLGDACNRLGWFAFRRSHVDRRLEHSHRNHTILDESKFFGNLDKALEQNDVDWADFFIDRYLDQTDRVEEILAILEKWLKERMTVKAFGLLQQFCGM